MDWVLELLRGDTWYETYLITYGLLALSHIIFQHWAAIRYTVDRNQWLQNELKEESQNTRQSPKVPIAALVPVYQEDLGQLRWCLEGLARQLYRGRFLAVVVDDGSYLKGIAECRRFIKVPPKADWWPRVLGHVPWVRHWRICRVAKVNYHAKLKELQEKRERLLALCLEYQVRFPKYFVFLESPENRGKRMAHKLAHDWVSANFRGLFGVGPFAYLTVDSDTQLDPLATEHMVRALIEGRAGAATGYVDIRNANVNWLTRMVDWRYWSAFHVERAAQSHFGSVMCCSGPLSIYRASLLDNPKLRLMEQYCTQTFLGLLCTFGDDRHMTNLILRAGYSVLFVPEASCLTYAPLTRGEYQKQQLRWNMSFYREMLWTLRALRMHSPYMTYDMLMQFLLPFMLIGSLGITVWLSIFQGEWQMAAWYMATVVGIGLLRSVYGAWMRKEWSYLLFSLYGFVYLWLLTVRFRALVKLFLQRDTGWQTRLG